MRGLLRALAVAAVGTGLVAGATHLPGRVDAPEHPRQLNFLTR